MVFVIFSRTKALVRRRWDAMAFCLPSDDLLTFNTFRIIVFLFSYYSCTGQAQAYAPPWTFNPPESIRVLKQTGVYDVATAKDQLVDIIKTTDCDGFTAEITEEYDDYVRATYTSPTFGFVDDVEFWFTRDDRSTVEYSSRSRTGKDDGGKNRNRIRTLRKALTTKYDWASVGF